MSAESTADSWNRQRDKARLEATLGIPEMPGAEAERYTFVSRTNPDDVVARGYIRVVYGDHGPYVELDRDRHVNWGAFTLNETKQRATLRYYDEWYSGDRSVMLYDQLRSVAGKAHAPKDGRDVASAGLVAGVCGGAGSWDRSVTGYADYQPGRVYVDPNALRVVLATVAPPATTTQAAMVAASGPANKKKKNRLQ